MIRVMLFFFLLSPTSQAIEELFPLKAPFKSGYLKVSDLHSINYMLFGNKEGKPVFVLHGGPGFGSYPRLTQYFNPEKFFIILHDQRGAGKSKPLGELRENTIQHLVADMEKLRIHLKIKEKLMIFGGSWGTTLGLAYSETHPKNVSCMVLRGVFTATQSEINFVWGTKGPRNFFPEAFDRLQKSLPLGLREIKPKDFLMVYESGNKALCNRVIAAWGRYGAQIGRLHTPKESLDQPFGGMDLLPCSRIDAHYMANQCFLKEGQLLKNAQKLKDIPIILINGRYDMVCPPITAFRLHNELPKSQLILVEEAGHSEGEQGITKELLKAVAAFQD